MATGGQSSKDKTGSAPIQETEQPPLPLATPCNVANTHLVSCQVVHRPAAMERDAQGCCEAVKAELKADFQTLKTEMNTRIDSMTSEISRKSIQIERLVQDRDQTRGELDNVREKLNLMEQQKCLDKRQHQMELQDKNDEIKRLRDLNKDLTDRNQNLEAQVKILTEEKKILEDCIQNHTHQIETLEAKLNSMTCSNDNLREEVDKLKVSLETVNQHQCNHDPESMVALEARMMDMEKMTETMTAKMTLLMSRSSGAGEQSLSHYKSGGSKPRAE